jgi:hypothetical protein
MEHGALELLPRHAVKQIHVPLRHLPREEAQVVAPLLLGDRRHPRTVLRSAGRGILANAQARDHQAKRGDGLPSRLPVSVDIAAALDAGSVDAASKRLCPNLRGFPNQRRLRAEPEAR